MSGNEDNPRFFPTPPDLRAWFEEHHDTAAELWVGYYKKATGLPGITWPESVDEALCYGWIDGIRKSVDDESYKIRFTPRRKRSHWSARNLGRMNHLIEAGLVTEAGLAAYRARDPGNEKRAAYERGEASLPSEYEAQLRAVPGGVALLEGGATVVPQAGDLVGGEREAREDPPAPPGSAD